MKVKTSELSGASLDWAVAMADGVVIIRNFPGFAYIPEGKRTYYKWTPSVNWKQGGPILERERIDLQAKINAGSDYDEWLATLGVGAKRRHRYGPTPLIAAMRCYVASKLGDEVDVPEHLL